MDSAERDRRWVEEHLLQHGDMLLYGNLSYEMESVPAQQLWQEFRKVGESYLGRGIDRTRMIHSLVDELIDTLVARDRRFGYPPPFCHKGCCNCCHELVYCTSEEADGIHDFCASHGISIDYDKVQRQLGYVDCDRVKDHTGTTTWHNQQIEDQSCVFLHHTDKFCIIWPVRPLVCRVHLAEETDRYCKPFNGLENPHALGINYVELSYVLSVIFTIHRDSIKKTMGRLLLESKKRS